jgi:hypothetical protein
LNAQELARTRQDRFIIDAYGMSAEELRSAHPALHQWLFDNVKPERDHNRRKSYAEKWWVFGEPRSRFRKAMENQDRFIATPETSKHRIFERFDSNVCPDHTLYAIVLREDWHFGVLQSRVHRVWALSAGGRQGVGNDPRYNNTRCFLTFPFPDAVAHSLEAIANAALQVEAHLKRVRSNQSTLTDIFNLVDARREGRPLTKKERAIHSRIATDALIQLLDDLDNAVLDAYGWSHDLDDQEIVELVLELNHERAAEEAQGRVRWLRPDLATTEQQATIASTKAKPKRIDAVDWPSDPFDQMAAVMAAARLRQGEFSVEDVATSFKRAPRKSVERYLVALAKQHLLSQSDDGRFRSTTVAA